MAEALHDQKSTEKSSGTPVPMSNKVRVKRALISVSDKTGVEGFARYLKDLGVEILSTGGTCKLLERAGIEVKEVSEYTEFPEMMDGRVKTLHPRVHGGILARRDLDEHVQAMGEHGIESIDLVCVNLYPFEKTVEKDDVDRPEAIEQIDIGGPSMVRSAAKNHAFVAVVTDPEDYGAVLDELEKNEGCTSEALRRRLAAKAFALTARYDSAISTWLHRSDHDDGVAESAFPVGASFAATKRFDLRYGENPHQKGAFYADTNCSEASVAGAEVLGGKALSYNNLVDLDAALALAKEFDEPFVCVIKHNNPCGAASAATIAEALERAWAGDPLSAFGSVLAFNRPVDLESAEFLVSERRFVEAIIAPSFQDKAFECLTQKPKWGKNVRLLACGPFESASRDTATLEVKRVVGGILLQDRDLLAERMEDCQVVTEAGPTPEQLEGLLFANKVGKHVKSNAIVLAQGTEIVGVGAGQMSRVDSVYLAARKAGERTKGSVLASDAFFPFPDGVEAAIEAGVGAILEPGGSMRDDAVIAACNKHGVPMVFTGSRHFKH